VTDEPTRFFVVHLQKSGGTSLRDRFRSTFGDHAIYPNASDGRDKRHSVISVSHLLDRWAARRHEVRVVAGHFPLATVGLLDAHFVTVSVLRPPVERTLSYLRHQRKVNRADRAQTLEEIYDDPFRFHGLIRNHMVRMFSIAADEMQRGDGVLTDTPDTLDRLERAKDSLASLDAFGLLPRFDEFCDDLAARYRLDLGPSLRVNTTDYEEPPPRLVERIAHDNALDVEFYEFAEQLYGERSTTR